MISTAKYANHAKTGTGTTAFPAAISFRVFRVVRGSSVSWQSWRDGYNAGHGNWSTHNYYHADGNGNITYLMTAGEGLAASYRYDAYGNLAGASGSLAVANGYRFSSKEQHERSGLYYYGYRFYSPNWQRWPNCDPLGEPGFETLRHGKVNLLGDGPNLYTFVQNNPVDRTDSLGLAISSIDGAMEACMKLPTPAMQQECISDLLDTLGVSKECCVLAAAVQVAKKAAGAMGKCNSGDSCAVLRAKSGAWLGLALARSRLHKKCFSGGDPGHQQALADAWKVIGDCTAYQVKNGCTGPL